MVKTFFGIGLAAILTACSTSTTAAKVAQPDAYAAFSAPTDPNPNEVRQVDLVKEPQVSTTVVTSN